MRQQEQNAAVWGNASPQDFGSSNLGSIPSTVVPVFLAELHSDSSHLKNALELFKVTMKARIPLGINEKANIHN